MPAVRRINRERIGYSEFKPTTGALDGNESFSQTDIDKATIRVYSCS